MPRLLLFLVLFLVLLAAPLAAQAQVPADSAALVTRLGEDTLSVERWVRTPDRLEAEAVIRAPRTARWRYVVDFDAQGNARRYTARQVDPADPAADTNTGATLLRSDEGWTYTALQDGEAQQWAVDADATLLPFIDLVFWPYELIVSRGADEAARTQPLLGGRRAMPFEVRRMDDGRIAVVHPTRGPSFVRTDARGRLLVLDAGETTRKVEVTRHAWLDTDATARRWAAADAHGRSVGELSGRAEETTEVAGAEIALDYGTPLARGRAIFGEVVPWGDLWRTGANRATHFTTDRALVLGTGDHAIAVPAGSYTLFTIPAPDGGTLIVNRQTGQNGQQYDEARDLGRVPMQRRTLDAHVERFTIRPVAAGADGGELRIEWDDTALVVPFRVAADD